MIERSRKNSKNKLSAFKYMGLLQTVENPPAVYWQLSERDYSKLTERLNRQKLEL